MIGIAVTGILFIIVALYAVIDGTIFEPDEVTSMSNGGELSDIINEEKSGHDCP